MRTTHQTDPLHRIERWTGTYFRPAALWEVGCYILVQHYNPEPICEYLQFQKQFLEEFETGKDTAEQRQLEQLGLTSPQQTARPSANDNDGDIQMGDGQGDPAGADYASERIQDETFQQFLDRLYETHGEAMDESAGNAEADDTAEVSEADDDIPNFPSYLPNQSDNSPSGIQDSANSDPAGPPIPRADILNNTYVRIVHSNGIHHLAMVSCQCHGSDSLPLDLVACRLMPASFATIRTLFSAQLLNSFRLANLELKASAYQFYQLLRRLTQPMAPAEVVDLYNEFRRMSRLWRWIKKLKWAGHGHNQKGAMNVGRGELANYCPACPQPGVNLPDDWKNDPHR